MENETSGVMGGGEDVKKRSGRGLRTEKCSLMALIPAT